jgi:hypothetical protein
MIRSARKLLAATVPRVTAAEQKSHQRLRPVHGFQRIADRGSADPADGTHHQHEEQEETEKESIEETE